MGPRVRACADLRSRPHVRRAGPDPAVHSTQVRAAVDPSSGDVAVAGGVGFALHSRSQARWRLFGDAAQERSFQVGGRWAWMLGARRTLGRGLG